MSECDCTVGYIVGGGEVCCVYKSDSKLVKGIIEVSNKYCPNCGKEAEDEV